MSATAAPARQASATLTAEVASPSSNFAAKFGPLSMVARVIFVTYFVLRLVTSRKATYVTMACVASVLSVVWGVYYLLDKDAATAIKEGASLSAVAEAKWFRKTAFSWQHVKPTLYIIFTLLLVQDSVIGVLLSLKGVSDGGATPRTEIKISRKSNFAAPDSTVRLHAQVRRRRSSSRGWTKTSTSQWRSSSYAASPSTTSWMIISWSSSSCSSSCPAT